MDELSAMINQVMSDPDAMSQLRSVAASLGINPQPAQQQPAYQPAYQPAQQPAQNSGMPDLSALSALLGNLQTQQAPPPAQNNIDLSALSGLLSGLGVNRQPPQAAPSAPDLSGLQGILGSIMGNGQAPSPPAQNTHAPNLSALTALLNNGNPSPQTSSGGGLGGLDMGMLMKLSQALSTVSSNRANIDLLLALKPRLKEERAKKVDDAIRVMQLVQFLPLIKESGLFGQMDSLLGSLTGGGGLGNILGSVGGGIGNVLGGLGLGGRR